MGVLVGLDRVSHEWPSGRVLNQVTLGIAEGARIGVVGGNGHGKSTLLAVLAGELVPDAGNLTVRSNTTVGVLGQTDKLDSCASVREAVVGDRPEYEWAADAKIREIVQTLVGDLAWDTPLSELSGGQRRRCDLARLLIGSWDVLLLDEPTNHLDLASIRWLAAHLKRRWPARTGALVAVTHDRWFLDEICETMWEVHDGMVDPFDGGWSAYIQQRVERDRVAQVLEERRQNALRKELNWLAHGAKARTSKPRFRVEAARALVANDPPLRNTLQLKRTAVARLGKLVIETEDASFAWPEQEALIQNLTWSLGPGDRIGLLGANGAGKSTLLGLLTGALQPQTGRIRRGASVRLGLMSQRLDSLHKHAQDRVLDVLSDYRSSYLVAGRHESPTHMAEGLGLGGSLLTTRISDLSGGQQRRLALLCVLLSEPNVLILDEPGNDLDTDMLSVLEDLLDDWPGSLIVVSHDRYLIERVTDDQYALLGRSLRHLPGGVDEYLRLEAATQPSPLVGQTNDETAPDGAAPQRSGLHGAERQALKRRQDAIERKLARLEKEPEKLQAHMATLPSTDYQALMDAQEKLNEVRAALDSLELEWLEVAEQLGDA